MSKKKETAMVGEPSPLDLLLMSEAELREYFAETDAAETEAELINVQNYLDYLRGQLLLLHGVAEEKSARAEVARKYANLSGPEKVALAQYLSVEGIDGKSQLGAV